MVVGGIRLWGVTGKQVIVGNLCHAQLTVVIVCISPTAFYRQSRRSYTHTYTH